MTSPVEQLGPIFEQGMTFPLLEGTYEVDLGTPIFDEDNQLLGYAIFAPGSEEATGVAQLDGNNNVVTVRLYRKPDDSLDEPIPVADFPDAHFAVVNSAEEEQPQLSPHQPQLSPRQPSPKPLQGLGTATLPPIAPLPQISPSNIGVPPAKIPPPLAPMSQQNLPPGITTTSTVVELRDAARQLGIDLGSAREKSAIIQTIDQALAQRGLPPIPRGSYLVQPQPSYQAHQTQPLPSLPQPSYQALPSYQAQPSYQPLPSYQAQPSYQALPSLPQPSYQSMPRAPQPSYQAQQPLPSLPQPYQSPTRQTYQAPQPSYAPSNLYQPRQPSYHAPSPQAPSPQQISNTPVRIRLGDLTTDQLHQLAEESGIDISDNPNDEELMRRIAATRGLPNSPVVAPSTPALAQSPYQPVMPAPSPSYRPGILGQIQAQAPSYSYGAPGYNGRYGNTIEDIRNFARQYGIILPSRAKKANIIAIIDRALAQRQPYEQQYPQPY